MRRKRLRGNWAAGLLLGAVLLSSCVSQQQDQEDLESSQEEVSEAEGQDNSSGQQEAGNQEAGLEQGNFQEGEGEAVGALQEGGAPSDLSSIINEMNQPPPANAAAGAGLGATEAAMATGGNNGGASGGGVVSGQAGSPAGAGLPEMGSKMAYVVVQGDTLSKISLRIYGTLKRWRELAKLSGIEDASLIYPGDLIYYQLSSESLAFASSYENMARQEVTVGAGETLGTIAEKVSGHSKDWKLLWRQNAAIGDPNRLETGSKIYFINPKALAAVRAQQLRKTSERQGPDVLSQAVDKNVLKVSQEGNGSDLEEALMISDMQTAADGDALVMSDLETAKV